MKTTGFRDEHAQITQTARAIAAIVRDTGKPETSAVAPLRWKLARQLTAHLAVEDRILYPRLLASESAAVASTARLFKAEMGDLAGAFTTYMTDWTPQRIGAEWPDFCHATTGVLTALARRITREDNELYVLAERAA